MSNSSADRDSEWPPLNDASRNSRSQSSDTRSDSFKNKTKSKKKKQIWNKILIEPAPYRDRQHAEFGRKIEIGNCPHNKNRIGYNHNNESKVSCRQKGIRNNDYLKERHYCNPPKPVEETVNNDTVLHVVDGVALSEAGLILDLQKHLEYLLSDVNLSSDDFFQSRMDFRGFIPIAAFLGCPKEKKNRATLTQLLKAATKSLKIELKGHFVRRIVDPLKYPQPKDSTCVYYGQYEYVLINGLWVVNEKGPDFHYSTDSIQNLEGAACSTNSETAPSFDPQFNSVHVPPQNDSTESHLEAADVATLHCMTDSQHEAPPSNGIADFQFENSDVIVEVQPEGACASSLEDSMANLQLQDLENSDSSEAAPLVDNVAELVCDDMPTVLLETYSVVSEDSGKLKVIEASSPVSDCVYFEHDGLTNSFNIVPINGHSTKVPYENGTSVYYPEDVCTAMNNSDCAVQMSPEPLR